MFKRVLFSGVVGCLLLTGCGLETYHSCDVPPQNRINVIKAGSHTKEQVLRMLGTPAFEIAETNSLVYMRQIKDSQAFLSPKEVERNIYVFSFDANDKLKKKRELTLEQARDISFDETITPTQKKELSVVKQLVQNFGRYNAGGQDSSVRQ